MTWLTLNAWDFRPIDSTATYGFNVLGGWGIYRTAGTNYFEAPVHLPSGAIVSALELAAGDTNVNSDLSVYFQVGQKATGSATGRSPTVATTGSGGWQVVSAPAFTPWTVNNDTESYTVEASFLGTSTNSLVLGSVRIGYKLQVSPAPNTATFGDVPTSHPFFQYIEALAASGITAGCSAPPNPNYCPDAPLTRGQMAVFISRALGLHFAP